MDHIVKRIIILLCKYVALYGERYFPFLFGRHIAHKHSENVPLFISSPGRCRYSLASTLFLDCFIPFNNVNLSLPNKCDVFDRLPYN